MTPAMAARKKDCRAKRGMLVSNIRWPIMSSCTTSISAAIKVMSCAPGGVTGKGAISSLKQERGQQRQRGEHKSRAEQVRHAEQAQLGIGGFNNDNRGGDQQQLGEVGQQTQSQRCRRGVRGESNGKEEVHQQRWDWVCW